MDSHSLYSHITYTLLVLVATLAWGLPQTTIANTDCPITIDEPADIMTLTYNDQITFSPFSIDTASNAAITVSNNTNCAFPVSLGSYRVYDKLPGTQELHDSQNKVIAPQSSALLHVNLPNCMSQIDLYHDPNHDGPPNPPTYANPKLIGWTFQMNNKDNQPENDMFHFDSGHPYYELDNFPGDDDDGFSNIPQPNRCNDLPPLQAQCSVAPQTANPGDLISWSSQASGGDGEYTYIWTGDATGNTATVTETYSTTGTKTAQVLIKSGNQQRSAQCDMTIESESPPQSLNVSCTTNPNEAQTGESVTWYVDTITGGEGGYTYTWTGAVTGTTGTTTKSYSTTGTKQSTVIVEDSAGNQSSGQCDVVISNNSGGNSDFNLSITDSFAWLVSNSSLRSTKAHIDLDALGGFSKPVTLTAASANFISNNDTKFVHDGGSPQEKITLQPSEFSDPLTVHVRENLTAATYPLNIFAKTPGQPTTTKSMTLYVRSLMEF